ncbi:hypothetical protein O181_043258 [Austropuccinia psidii MF-1]|uniref:Uncharacterized protein n=1 Tax=Austropuccinia psidii MF-1 TaxID=1389203 RepID=A0A9Q3HFI1_9BASI|nr:hypothetical protein [Austropuccinia psidii MF-1]
MEETFPSSPTPIVTKKKKAKKLDFLGPTIQDSEDGTGLRTRIDPSKGKRKGKISSGTESTQGSAISQRQVPEIPMISEPELQLGMSNSNKEKSNSESSKRHLHEPVQEVLHHVQGKGLVNVATNPPRRDELLVHPQRGGNSEILQ